MATVGVFLHVWGEINPEQHRAHVSCEREGGGWLNYTRTLTVPDGWHVAESKGNELHLYDDKGEPVQFCRIATHRKAVEVISSGGPRWVAMADAESVCCPTCGHPL
jgi:hypothetical protein